MAAWAALAFSLRRISPPTPAAKMTLRRGLAGSGDHHGPPKVNIWEDPLSPSKWKEEHFVLASLSGWGDARLGRIQAFWWKEVATASAH